MQVNGFYGHVRANDLRSLAMFGGFIVAYQLLAFAVLAIPIALLDWRMLPFVNPLGYMATWGLAVLILSVVLFVVRFRAHVASVQTATHFHEMMRHDDPRLFGLVERLAVTAGVPVPKLGWIDSPAMNSFACGIDRRHAVVVVTRGLLAGLDDDELEAVLAHEIAHIANNDIRLMAAANVMLGNMERLARWNVLKFTWWKAAIGVFFIPLFMVCAGGGAIQKAAMSVARASRLLVATSRELIADAEAVRLTHKPAALISALVHIEGRSRILGLDPKLDAMMIDGPTEGEHANHPTVAERVALLAELSGPMIHGAETPLGPRHTPWGEAPADGPTFGKRAARSVPSLSGPRAALAEPAPGSVFARVNKGSESNWLGMTRGARMAIGIAGGVLLLAQVTSMVAFNRAMATPEARQREAAYKDMREQNEVLNRADPLASRCFAPWESQTATHRTRTLRAPSEAKVQDYIAHPERDSTDIERYFAIHRRMRPAATADDAALLDYAMLRARLTDVVWAFYGEPGLAAFAREYDTPADRALNARIAERMAAGSTVLLADGKKAGAMRLLVAAPADFIPCRARAKIMARAGAPSGVLTAEPAVDASGLPEGVADEMVAPFGIPLSIAQPFSSTSGAESGTGSGTAGREATLARLPGPSGTEPSSVPVEGERSDDRSMAATPDADPRTAPPPADASPASEPLDGGLAATELLAVPTPRPARAEAPATREPARQQGGIVVVGG